MILICWILLCVAVGAAAKNRGRGFWPYTLLSALISPIGGFIVLLIVGRKTPQ